MEEEGKKLFYLIDGVEQELEALEVELENMVLLSESAQVVTLRPDIELALERVQTIRRCNNEIGKVQSQQTSTNWHLP